MRKIIFLISIIFIWACSSNKDFSQSNDSSYGYKEKNPIKVGGFDNGPSNERNYLNSLTGPNGEKVLFYRNGSCCQFNTKNSPFGSGMLDIYSVYYEGIKDTAKLYINMYDKGVLKAPVGFKFKN